MPYVPDEWEPDAEANILFEEHMHALEAEHEILTWLKEESLIRTEGEESPEWWYESGKEEPPTGPTKEQWMDSQDGETVDTWVDYYEPEPDYEPWQAEQVCNIPEEELPF